jgi:hypothetical protein
MVEEPPHVKQLPLSQLCKIGLSYFPVGKYAISRFIVDNPFCNTLQASSAGKTKM